MKNHPRRPRSVHAIVPLNVLKKSKARLSRHLNAVQREQLTVAMLKDVLSALRETRRVHSVLVVTADKTAREITKNFGATFLWEGKRRGLNKGVSLALKKVQSEGAKAVLVLHCDLPFLKSREIDKFLNQAEGHAIAITPSKDGSGTNALFLKPPQAIRPVFGKNSFRRHLALAKKRGLPYKVMRFRGMSFDIDNPRDLAQLMRRPPRNESGRFLKTFGKD